MINNRKPVPKTQRDLSIARQEPYIPPAGAPGFSPRGNPNDFGNPSRATQTSFKNDTTKPYSIGIQDIDEAVMYYIQNEIQPFVIQNEERLSVPLIYGSPEKWKSFQKDGYYRDLNGRIMAPLMMIKRNTIDKIRSITNKLDANNPHNIAVFGQKYSKKNEYSSFNTLNNNKPNKTYYTTVVPDYLSITYDCVLFTYYNDQLAKLIEMMEYASDSYWGNPDRFKFKVNIDSFSTVSELSDNAERVVRATFSLKLFGYIIPDIPQRDLNAARKFSEITKVNFGLETTGGDIENFVANTQQSIAQKAGIASIIDSPNVTNNITNISINGGLDTNVSTYLNTNNHATATFVNSTTVTFPYSWITAPIPLPATSLDNFVFFCNGQLIERTAIISFSYSVGSSTLVIDTAALGFGFISTDEIIGIGKFDV
jgi:hypothetical protein